MFEHVIVFFVILFFLRTKECRSMGNRSTGNPPNPLLNHCSLDYHRRKAPFMPIFPSLAVTGNHKEALEFVGCLAHPQGKGSTRTPWEKRKNITSQTSIIGLNRFALPGPPVKINENQALVNTIEN